MVCQAQAIPYVVYTTAINLAIDSLQAWIYHFVALQNFSKQAPRYTIKMLVSRNDGMACTHHAAKTKAKTIAVQYQEQQ
jgi:hypothetical protein